MFDAASKQQLEEMLGYERFVLDDTIRRLEMIRGVNHPQRLTIRDDSSCTIDAFCHMSVSGPAVEAIYDQLTGLLFSAAYKVLDMIVEWTLRENGMPATVWQFSGKVGWWRANANIAFPDFLGSDPQLVGVLQQCYERFLPYRNAMTHGKWGEMKDGALHFNITDNKGVMHVATFTPQQTMAWVDAMSRIASMLLVPATVTAKSIKAVKQKLNHLQPHHGGAFFSPPGLRSFRVIRITEAVIPFPVDMQMIRFRVEQQSHGEPYEIELRIESGKEGNRSCWEIPPENVPMNDFPLDSTFDRFKVNP